MQNIHSKNIHFLKEAVLPTASGGSAQNTRLVIGAPHFPHVVESDFLPNLIFGGPTQIT